MEFHYSDLPININTAYPSIAIITNLNHSSFVICLLKSYFYKSKILVYSALETEKAKHAQLIIMMQVDNSILDGSFSIQSGNMYNCPAICIIGGGIAGLIYATRTLQNKIKQEDSIFIDALTIHETPSLPYRFFWTWDHSTNWYIEQQGMQEIGFSNPYTKPVDGFLNDYFRLIDFMSINRINGLTIYGFLRDSHGGIESAQAICNYANERGVRIFPGVGINCYGGIYWEGSHPYHLSNWLKKYPLLRAEFLQPSEFNLPDFQRLYLPETFYLNTACPSKPENIAYHVEALQWLAETFNIGGINFETGDYGICQCSTCTKRRNTNQQWSMHDMAEVYPKLFTAVKKLKSDAWLICEAYWDNLLDLDALAPLSDLPSDFIYQFCINRKYWQQLKSLLTPEHVKNLPHPINILRTHMGSQWQQERYSFVGKRFSEMMQLVHQMGLKGGTIFGEVSSFNPINEINYLAFARFGYDATLTWDNFLQDDLAYLFGSSEASIDFIDLFHAEPGTLNSAIDKAREIANQYTGDIYRRWIWLQNRLFQKLVMQ